jgi:hypothetical protein
MKTIATNIELRDTFISKGIKRAKFFSWDKTSNLLWKSIKKTVDGQA